MGRARPSRRGVNKCRRWLRIGLLPASTTHRFIRARCLALPLQPRAPPSSLATRAQGCRGPERSRPEGVWIHGQFVPHRLCVTIANASCRGAADALRHNVNTAERAKYQECNRHCSAPPRCMRLRTAEKLRSRWRCFACTTKSGVPRSPHVATPQLKPHIPGPLLLCDGLSSIPSSCCRRNGRCTRMLTEVPSPDGSVPNSQPHTNHKTQHRTYTDYHKKRTKITA